MTEAQRPRLLLIDTAGAVGRVGASRGDRLLAATELDVTRRHVRDIVPGIRRVAGAAGCELASFDAVAVNTGPGSLTGIRVGLALAKALAYANGMRLIGVSGFDAVARRFEAVAGSLAVLFAGQLGTVLVGRFDDARNGSAVVSSLTPPQLADAMAPGTWLAGPAAEAAGGLPGVRLVDPPREAGLAELAAVAARRWAGGAFDDAFALEPVYVRPSSAEVKWDERPPR